MTAEEAKEAFLRAAREARHESPMIGKDTLDEWTLRGRIAIQLARRKDVEKLEDKGIHVDIEYGHVSVHEVRKIPGAGRVDLIIHRRGSMAQNLLGVELKVADARARKVDSKDASKLIELTKDCAFQIGIWLRLPKTKQGHPGRYAVCRNGTLEDLQDL